MRFRKAVVFFAATLSFLTSIAVFASPLIIARGELQETPPIPRIEVLSTRSDGVTLEFRLPAIMVEDITVNGESFQNVTIPGGWTTGAIGAPEIPTFTRMVSIPATAAVRIRTTVTQEEELRGYRLNPMQPDNEENPPFTIDRSAYTRNDFGTSPIAAVGRPAVLRDLRIVPLRFQPVRYNPTTGVCKVARTVRVEVEFSGNDPENVLESVPPRPIALSFDRMYRELVVNYRGPESGLGVMPGTWVVICQNDANVTSRLQPLLDWHKRKGYPVRLATTSEAGTTKEAIQTWLRTAYATWPSPPEYVTIVGDADGTYSIPTWHETLSGYNGGGDHPYSQLAGGDILADCHVGRLSISSLTELDVQVTKCVSYESTPYTSQDQGWFTRAALCGDPNDSGYSCVQIMQWAKVRLREIGYTQVDTIFNGDFVTGMVNALNRGDSVFSYRGIYGMSGIQNGNISTLSNYWKLPFCVVITCDTGTFYSGTSRSEAFLRAGTVTNPRAGIGCIGTSTTGTHTRNNNCITYGILYGLLYADQYTMGAALTRGKLELYLNYAGVEDNVVTIWTYWNNLMGDPGVEIFTGFPSNIRVTHPSSLPIGATSFTAVVTENSLPTPDAMVCVWKGSETYSVGFTDSQGRIELPTTLPTAGNLLLTVSKHNKLPYAVTVPVAAQNVYVAYQSSSVSDDNVGQSHGNGDSIINPNETIELRVTVRNFGSQTATGVSATLTTEDPYVTITNATQSYGSIAGGATATSAGNYAFSVAAGCPHGRSLRFGLDIVSGVNQWHSLIELGVVSADLVAEGVTWTNVGSNGRLDPGEAGQLSVKVRNLGGMNATGVTGTLTSLSPFVTVTDGAGSFGTIAVGALGENTTDRFSVLAASNTFQGYLATMQLVTQFSGGLVDTTIVTFTVGDRASIDPIGPDSYGYYAFDDTDTNYEEHPTYGWIELDPSYGGSGATQVPLTDYGTYQDDSEVITLPFTFTYYGKEFTRATICSNGWIAMGSTYTAEYRNWTIPGAGGPENMIAVFWDDLNLGGGGKVLTKYEAATHRFTVEWSRLYNENGGLQTCEAILFDPAFVQTPSGDGVIVMQYHDVDNNDYADNYATAGIENELHSDGLLYTFENRYPTGAAPLQAGRAIKFAPTAALPSGMIQGTVRNASNGESPVAGAEVVLVETGRTFTTGEDGVYAGSASMGTYTVIARNASFRPDTTHAVTILAGQVTTVNFSLTDIMGPSITAVTNIQTTGDTAGPYPIEATISDYSAVASAKIYYRRNNGAWIDLAMTPSGDVYSALIPGMPAGTRIDYYVWAKDPGENVSTSPADAPGSFYSLFITQTLYSFDGESAPTGWQMGNSGDTATTGVWICDDPIGTTYGDPPVPVQPEDDATPDPGTKCFVTGNGSVGGAAGENDVDGGCTTLLSPAIDLGGAEIAFLTYRRWFGLNGNSVDDTWAIEASGDGGASWVSWETVEGNQNHWEQVKKNIADVFNPLPSTIQLRFLACDLNNPGLVEAAVDDFSIDVFIADLSAAPETAIPARSGLGVVRPNPFRPATTIQYGMARPGSAEIKIFDVSGRVVRSLFSGISAAGYHTVVWDGRDDRGASVPSGIYFCRLHAAGAPSDVRKLIHIE
jgi:hypothetical protein